MSRIDLPDGAWAELADPKKVPERKRRPVVAASTAMAAHKGDFAAFSEGDAAPGVDLVAAADVLNDAAVVALVSSWSFGDTVSTEALMDLPGDAYDALRSAIAPLVLDLLPTFGPSPDPKARTDNSEALPTT